MDTVCTHFSPSTMASLVECVTNYLLENSGDCRKKIGQLLIQLVNKNLLLKTQFVKGLQNVLEFAADIVVDVPKIWDYFGEIFGKFKVSNQSGWGAAKHRCSILASHPAALGLIPRIPKKSEEKLAMALRLINCAGKRKVV